ncbi:hypothetical protein K9L05_03770 [Candidatus Babeliales bacterium]|nr:hypothetical protein [Candidatus Babeliales bacterium]MCF7899736.1 hypothetical protein [Candidatus Babeliales bacterium]
MLSPKIFLRLLLVLSEDELEPLEDLEPFLDKLSLLVTNNRLVNYDLALAQALLVTNNHREKNNILNHLGIDKGEIDDNIYAGDNGLHLSNKNLGDPSNYSKFLFWLAVAQILKSKILFLSNNQLSSLPTEIGNLTSLEDLSLFRNQLMSLPVEIGNLTRLNYLTLFENQLSSLPAEIGNLTNLNYLGLSNNQFTSLPAEIGNLTGLVRLCLSKNQLNSLPTEIGNLSNLNDLYLDSNQLSSLPSTIGDLFKNHINPRLNLTNNPGLLSNPEAQDIIERLKAKRIL